VSHLADLAHRMLCGIVLLVVVLILFGDYSLPTLMAYNSTLVPPRFEMTVEHLWEVVPGKSIDTVSMLLR